MVLRTASFVFLLFHGSAGQTQPFWPREPLFCSSPHRVNQPEPTGTTRTQAEEHGGTLPDVCCILGLVRLQAHCGHPVTRPSNLLEIPGKGIVHPKMTIHPRVVSNLFLGKQSEELTGPIDFHMNKQYSESQWDPKLNISFIVKAIYSPHCKKKTFSSLFQVKSMFSYWKQSDFPRTCVHLQW